MSFPVIDVHTPRLLLRLPTEGDVRALMEIHEHPDVWKHVTLAASATGLTVACRNVAVLLGHWHLRGYGHWVVVEKATGNVIGRVGFYNPEGWPGIELGYVTRDAAAAHGDARRRSNPHLRHRPSSASVGIRCNRVVSVCSSRRYRIVR
jgi:RimJ/RimL family protein N-acetyltransferase